MSIVERIALNLTTGAGIVLSAKEASELMDHISKIEARLDFVEGRYNDFKECITTAQKSVQALLDDVKPPFKTWGQKIDLGED